MIKAIPLFVLLCGLFSPAAAQVPYRVGLQFGVSGESSNHRWIGVQDETRESVATQHGLFGLVFAFPLHERWELEFSPHYGQRNTPKSTWERSTGISYSFTMENVDYLSIPITAKYFLLSGGILRPFAAAGIAAGLNLSHTSFVVKESRMAEEPPFLIEKESRLYLHQLFGSSILEAGIDIQASESWAAVLAARYSFEWTPLVDDDLFTWDTPSNWKIRFALLYTIDL